jgi:hypothetical protein
MEALLGVAVSMIRHVPLRRPYIREQLVSAYERLHQSHGLKMKAFCESLGLKERTFRSWRMRPPTGPAKPPLEKEAEKKPRRPR